MSMLSTALRRFSGSAFTALFCRRPIVGRYRANPFPPNMLAVIFSLRPGSYLFQCPRNLQSRRSYRRIQTANQYCDKCQDQGLDYGTVRYDERDEETG